MYVTATHVKAFNHCRANTFVRQKQKKARSFSSADLFLSTCLGRITVRSKDGRRCSLQRLCALQL